MTVILFLLLIFPLAGGVINAVVGRLLPRRVSEVIACLAIGLSLAMAALAAFVSGGKAMHLVFFEWIRAGSFSTAFDVFYDPLAAVMVLMVTFVSGIIHIYSVAYMREDTDYVRYFAYLNLFVFSMLVIALADNLIFVYLGWEGVGFCSYALIGFWYTNLDYATAGRKAFIMTRIGDVTFGVALALFLYLFHSFSLQYINAHADTLSVTMATVFGLLLLWAAMGKSAQLPLTVWLPDAMAGPTPVSALIHAATMVTAGAYLLMRLFPVFHHAPIAMLVIAGAGAVTTLYASFAALAQVDIKKVLAYSTISQVGYMILGVGAGDFVGGFYHLLSHAFFKSLLFLGAGCIIQALDEEHNIFKMGNLRRLMPHVFYPFLIGSLSLAAFPMIGGFVSKDRVLEATFIHPYPIYKAFWAIAFLAALLTVVYTFRMFFTAFLDRPDGRTADNVKPIPRLMIWVMWPLAILAFCDGLLNLPFGPGKDWLAKFLASVPGARVDLGAPSMVSWGLGLGDGFLVVLLLITTYLIFRRPRPDFWGALNETLFTAFYLDWLYLNFIARPYQWFSGILWGKVDEGGVDRGYESTARGFKIFSGFIGLWTTGRLSTYLTMIFLALTMMFAVLAISWSW
ncbi:MAG TPA: NADH-quinone oxidoreductase subunit L [Desulfobaccales bacterium]|nr:NADH-quinone oxidoreductase subunit L [Desulfobaccales bacterium]